MTEGTEKRRATRAEVKTRCPAIVYTDAGQAAGTLVNISAVGARVQLATELGDLEVGDRLRLDLSTPYGNCACESRLAWRDNATIGVEFTEMPVDPKDPLLRFVHAPGVLHWMWRTFWDVQDRRTQPRAYLTTFCPVSFTFDGAPRTASMRNVSEAGAMLQVDGVDSFPPGTELDLTIRTPAGESQCRARVMWTDHSDEGAFLAGVQFVDLTADQAEPLRALIDAPF